ncbi:hypothetical protein PsorP6_017792 [Peronosclerospora sorghi]|uniref:Uncharacterized protein n=1 Tax=Peronosclerospora sorghi TaxID=230839 RepID=A0ACC0WLI0_9STRA|nr:hypothetical protein PsorP6_017792 [Peronosclerospora sorghi]
MQHQFPLPTEYFADFDLTSNEVQHYQTLASDIVQETKRDLDNYIKDGKNHINERKWKLVKSKERLHCYRKRSTMNSGHQHGLYGSSESSSEESSVNSLRSHLSLSARSQSELNGNSQVSASTRPSEIGESSRRSLKPIVVGYGIMDGTVDDVVFGLHQSSTDEMKTLAKFHSDNSMIDCAVLKTIRKTQSTYLGVKWKLTRSVGGNRDCCYLEYVGLAEDATGQRYGFHLLESVVVRDCPPFNDNSVVRSNMSFCFIFRAGKIADQVEVFMEGAYDSSADALSAGGVGDYRSTMELLFNLPNAMTLAEVKKISAMVARQLGALRGSSSKNQSGNNCSICRVKFKLLSTHTTCQTCGAVICSKCRIKKMTFCSRGKIKVYCCKLCMVMVRDQSPFAGEELEPQPISRDEISCRESSSSSSCNNMEAMNASISTDSLTDSDYSSSFNSWQSNSILRSEHEDSFYASNSSIDRKMPALIESDLPSRTSLTYDGEPQPRYELQQIRDKELLIRQRLNQGMNASDLSLSSQRQRAVREGLYHQMVELQIQADRIYNLTNQNANMMNTQR